MIMAGALSVTPVRPYFTLHTLRTYVPIDVRSLTRIFLSEFYELGHIVKYRNVFFKFDNGIYHTRLSVVMALC